MSKYIGKGAIINKPEVITHGKHCVIRYYSQDKKKYSVDFDMGWIGWYKLKELKIDKTSK